MVRPGPACGPRLLMGLEKSAIALDSNSPLARQGWPEGRVFKGHAENNGRLDAGAQPGATGLQKGRQTVRTGGRTGPWAYDCCNRGCCATRVKLLCAQVELGVQETSRPKAPKLR